MFNILKNPEGTVDDYEAFLEKYSSVLHKNHYHMVTAKHSLMQMLGRTEGHLIQDMDAEGVRTGIFHSMYFFYFLTIQFVLSVFAFCCCFCCFLYYAAPAAVASAADNDVAVCLVLTALDASAMAALVLLAAVDDSTAKNIAAVCGLLVLIVN